MLPKLVPLTNEELAMLITTIEVFVGEYVGVATNEQITAMEVLQEKLRKEANS